MQNRPFIGGLRAELLVQPRSSLLIQPSLIRTPPSLAAPTGSGHLGSRRKASIESGHKLSPSPTAFVLVSLYIGPAFLPLLAITVFKYASWPFWPLGFIFHPLPLNPSFPSLPAASHRYPLIMSLLGFSCSGLIRQTQ